MGVAGLAVVACVLRRGALALHSGQVTLYLPRPLLLTKALHGGKLAMRPRVTAARMVDTVAGP